MSALQWIGKFPVVDALGWTLVHSLWQGLAIAVVVAIALRAMRGRTAQARYVVAIVSMMVLPACAVVTFGLLNRRAAPILALLPDAAPVVPGAQIQPLHIAPLVSPTIDLPQSWDQKLRPMLPWLVLAWAIGVIVLGLYQLGGWMLVQRMRRTGEPFDDACAVATFHQLIDRLKIARPVRLARSALVQVPTVIGWLRPVVLLPMSALTGLTSDQLAGLLAHELAHVRRHDYLINILQTIVETLLFYHPAVWWMSRIVRQERENACDDLAAQVCDRATYARALAAMESLRQSPAQALGARGGALLPRIRRILGIQEHHARRAVVSGFATGFVAVAIVISVLVLNACSSTTKPVQLKREPATQSVTEDDLKPNEGDYTIGGNDLLQVSITGLLANGADTVKQTRVAESGKISLPYIGQIEAADKTEVELEKDVARAYEDANFIKNAVVSVTVIEPRARTFSILGAVNQPGKYAIPKNDFRLLDALVLARDVNPSAETLWILRRQPSKPANETRKIEIPLEPVRQGASRYNVVIRPEDTIIVPMPQRTPIVANADNAVQKKELELLKLDADSTTGIEAAQADLKAKQIDYDRKAKNPNVFGDSEVQEAKIHVIQAETQLKVAQEAHERAKLKYELEQARQAAGAVTPAAQSAPASPRASAAPNERILQLQMALDQTLLALEANKRELGPQHPKVVALEQQIAQLNHALQQTKGASSTTQPSDDTAAHFVRLVIGRDSMTFEGKPVTWDNIRDELKHVPDRPNTALELAMGSEDVTIGQENKARGMASALVSEFGFKYLTLIGLHALGSKAGEAAPVTQPSARVAPKPTEYYMGGHVQRSGVYSITDRKITLRQAIWAAGGFDDPSLGDDTRIRILRRADGNEKILDFTWGDIGKPNNDPFLQPNDTIEVGTLPPTTQRAEMQRARELWNAAVDAERKQDWPSAIRNYEQLKQLDPSNRAQTDRLIDNAITFVKREMGN